MLTPIHGREAAYNYRSFMISCPDCTLHTARHLIQIQYSAVIAHVPCESMIVTRHMLCDALIWRGCIDAFYLISIITYMAKPNKSLTDLLFAQDLAS